MSSGVFLDDVDLATYGASASVAGGDPVVEGVDDGATLAFPADEAVNRFGEVLMATEPSIKGRDIVVPLLVDAASHAALLAAVDAIKYLAGGMSGREVRLRFARSATREFRVRRSSIAVQWGVPFYSATQAAMRLAFRASTPSARATSDTVLAFTTNTAVVLGTAPSRPYITIVAGGSGATNPYVILKNAAGTEVGRLAYTKVMAAGDEFRIDLRTGLTEYFTASGSTLSNGAPYRSDAYQATLLLDPDDGAPLTPTYPSLSGAVSAGSAVFTATYRAEWD